MDNHMGVMTINEEEKMGLPPGFRFHPTDEELITHYLSKKAVDGEFSSTAITEVDLNKSEPWELPWKAKMGEKEWYFFCVRDRKYPTGLRTNRATKAGYWKATGKDKPILRGKSLVGMKKTLVFYEGRAPRGQKTSWVMHEFRLEGKFSFHGVPPAIQNEWVICRVFQKSSSGKKVQHVSGMMKMASESPSSSSVPEAQINGMVNPPTSESMHLFTSSMDEARGGQSDGLSYSYPPLACLQAQVQPHQMSGGWQLNGWLQEQTYMRSMIENHAQEKDMGSISQEHGCSSVEINNEICNGEFDCLWNY